MMLQLIHEFWYHSPNSHPQLAVAWFVPLIASGIGSLIGGLFAPKKPTFDPSKFQQGADPNNLAGRIAGLDANPNQANPFITQQNEWRAGQQQLADTLAQTSQGKGPSLAEAIVNQQLQKQQAANMGAVASQPGRGNAALSQRLVGQGNASLGATGIEQARLGRLQEIFNAQGQLGQVLGQGRAGDISAGGLALQGDAQRQAQIQAVMQMIQQRQQFGESLGAQGEALRLGQGNASADATSKLIGGALSGAAGALTTGITGADAQATAATAEAAAQRRHEEFLATLARQNTPQQVPWQNTYGSPGMPK